MRRIRKSLEFFCYLVSLRNMSLSLPLSPSFSLCIYLHKLLKFTSSTDDCPATTKDIRFWNWKDEEAIDEYSSENKAINIGQTVVKVVNVMFVRGIFRSLEITSNLWFSIIVFWLDHPKILFQRFTLYFSRSAFQNRFVEQRNFVLTFARFYFS